jgi:hypothetical protein
VKTILIGIHGLRNKPPKYTLTSWWKKSIIEGFKVIKLPVPRVHFEMAYWAHYIHTIPQNPRIQDPDNPVHCLDPYVPGTIFGPREPDTFKKKLSADFTQQLLQLIIHKTGFSNIDKLSDIILRLMFIRSEEHTSELHTRFL